MNILIFLNQDTFYGGAENVLRQVGEYYLKNNHEVYVLFLRKSKYLHWEILQNSRLHCFYGGSIKKFYKNICHLSHLQFDYSFSSLVDFTGILGLLKRLNILHINHMIGRESTSIFSRFKGVALWRKKMMYHIGYPALDTLICQTQYMKEQLLRNLPWIEKKRVIVVPNPVCIHQMRERAEETVDVSVIKPYIISAGRFIAEKGFDILIEAFCNLKVYNNSLKLVILGDGKLKGEIEEKISVLGIQDSVFLPGFKENVYPWFKHAEMCVVSSRAEGFPNVLLQMMSQNNKVVCTLCAGDIEKIKGVYTCPPNDVSALYTSMKQCLSSESSDTRELFDKELLSRSIDCFIEKATCKDNSVENK